MVSFVEPALDEDGSNQHQIVEEISQVLSISSVSCLGI